MNILGVGVLAKAFRRHADTRAPLEAWYVTAKQAAWKSLHEVRQTWAGADWVDERTVFNIKGNSYRLIVVIHYETQTIIVRNLLTHAEYDKEDWK